MRSGGTAACAHAPAGTGVLRGAAGGTGLFCGSVAAMAWWDLDFTAASAAGMPRDVAAAPPLALLFRCRANQNLREYMIKSSVMADERWKNHIGRPDSFDEFWSA